MTTTFTNCAFFLLLLLMEKYNASVHLPKCKANNELNNRESGSGLVYGCSRREIQQSLHATFCKSFRASLAVKPYLFTQTLIFVMWSSVETAEEAQRHIDDEFYSIYESMFKFEVWGKLRQCSLETGAVQSWRTTDGISERCAKDNKQRCFFFFSKPSQQDSVHVLY